ncbi:Iron transport multicopper oxidase fio1 [Hypsizygus marmoreus]|uniref:Iron transport multicopper oxidase fio1 n=1 Tax=Hypsizygus marmoreus TaxID=39966 RepID=A0A369KCV2_HYPMA|nr:Iron transport multicopper oxidase fio1 [Hypsizygus marmoreus]
MQPFCFTLLLLLVTPAFAGVQEVWWNLTYVENANPDGLFDRRAVGVNGTWPPPPLDVHTNDLLVVHTTNSLDRPSTLHHHGMFFNKTSWMDGAQGVTECGIPPGGQFDYVVPINSSDQWGTYWVHSHASGHYVDGLRAPFVLHPEKEVYSYDEEFTVILGDWYHDEHAELMKQFVSIANPGGAEPVPESGLIYFAQNATYLGPIKGTSPSPVTSAVGFNENATLPFVPGKTYRLRIVNTAAFAAFYFWIDGHDMRIIEIDGTDVEESPIDLIALTVAQRYSVLVTARNDTSSNWAIHANMDTEMFDTIPPALNPNVTSSITYDASAQLTDLGFVDEYHDVADVDLVPVIKIPQPVATKTIELEVIFETQDDGTNHAMFNQITYNSPLVPAVFSELSLGPNATVAEAYGPLSFVIDHMDVVDLVIQNGDAGKHPFHLHGHKFQIVGRSEDYTSDDPELNPPIVEGQANPVRRDTVQIPSMHSATLRIVADNPGVWFMHCHIEWHLEVGLAIQLVEAPLLAQQHNNVPQIMYDHCKTLGKPTSGNAAGHASTSDLTGLPLGPFPQKLGWRPKGIAAMFGCVLTAVLGMASVVWYALGGHMTDEEVEHEERKRIEAKERRKKRFFGFGRVTT